MLTGRDGDDLVFGRTATRRFIPSTVRHRARRAWEDAGLEPIALHECRHTAASVMREAGIDDKLRAAILGHASVVITNDATPTSTGPFDRRRHPARRLFGWRSAGKRGRGGAAWSGVERYGFGSRPGKSAVDRGAQRRSNPRGGTQETSASSGVSPFTRRPRDDWRDNSAGGRARRAPDRRKVHGTPARTQGAVGNQAWEEP